METQSVLASSAQSAGAGQTERNAASALGGDDFFELLIAQLVNQDPLEPTSNQDLLNQISSIRDIELSTSLSDSLTMLTQQQRFASAGSLIGNFVSGQDQGGQEASGTVAAVRFDASGQAILELEDGTRLSLDSVESIRGGGDAGESLVGRFVTGVDRTDPASPRVIEGIVTEVTKNEAGEMAAELDTGESLPLTSVIDARAAKDADGAGGLLSAIADLL